MAVCILENARRYLLRAYGRIDVNDPDPLLDAVREDGMMMVTSDETIDAEEVIFDCIDKILNPPQKPFHWWR
jgi:hypothetical protein